MSKFRWWVLVVLAGFLGYVLKDRIFPPKVQQLEVQEEPVTLNEARKPLQGSDLLRSSLLSGLAWNTSAGFPGAIPWIASMKIGESDLFPLEAILHYHPTVFFRMGLNRYDRTVQSYTTTFYKQETVNGKKLNAERIAVSFRENPFSVFFEWKEGAGLAKRVLYVEGHNNDQMKVRPTGIGSFLTVSRPVDGPDAKNSGRYTIRDFGLKKAMQRTVASMEAARDRDALFIRYHGIVKVDKLNQRPCYKFVRTPYQPLEEEGVNELTLYVDLENWLQVGSVLKNAQGEVLAEYYFGDLDINPELKVGLFTDKSV